MKNEILRLLEESFTYDRFYKVVQNQDFILKWDESEDHLTLCWIYNISNKYRGREIFQSLVRYCRKKNIPQITAYCVRGFDTVHLNGKRIKIQDTGYYNLFRWGFRPDKGVRLINKTLKSNYLTIESATRSPIFWKKWKANGVSFTGTFEIEKPTH